MAAPKGNQFAKGHGCGRPKVWTDEKIAEEAQFLREWANKEDSIVIGECYGLRGYSFDSSIEWEKTNKDFAEAKRYAKTMIGSRRERLALQGAVDSGIVRCSMGVYDPEHRAYLKEMKSADLAQKAANIHVNVRGIVDESK